MKCIVGVIHAVRLEDGTQTTFVERAVVCHERQILDERLDLAPHVGEDWRIVGVVLGDAVYAAAPIAVEVWLRVYQRVERVGDFGIADHDNAYAAY